LIRFKDIFYNLPNSKEKRSSSIGYGNKITFGISNLKTPGPGSY